MPLGRRRVRGMGRVWIGGERGLRGRSATWGKGVVRVVRVVRGVGAGNALSPG